ncbi:hypothetical protein [Caldithrix abyssi]
MPVVLFLNSGDSVSEEEMALLKHFSHWEWILYQKSDNAKTLNQKLKNREIHFIISNRIDDFILDRIRERFPVSPIIYYASRLDSQTLKRLYRAGIEHCVIGDSRQALLIDLLHKLWEKHWKRLPSALLPKKKTVFVKKVARFIEEEPISFFNIKYMANTLQLTEYQFRDQFKKSFQVNFRTFKQKVLDHYESLLLFEKKLTPGRIYPMLNYRNLSAFSRSFKVRHGNSWQNVMRLLEY